VARKNLELEIACRKLTYAGYVFNLIFGKFGKNNVFSAILGSFSVMAA